MLAGTFGNEEVRVLLVSSIPAVGDVVWVGGEFTGQARLNENDLTFYLTP